MGETFELWARRELGELYAVRRVAGRATGVCGPIPIDALATVDLSRCEYEDRRRPGGLSHEFVPAERWVLGFENQAVILGALARARRATASGDRDDYPRPGAEADMASLLSPVPITPSGRRRSRPPERSARRSRG